MYPALLAPLRQRLARADAEVVEGRISSISGKFGSHEPSARKLALTVGHVFAAEYAQGKHFCWRELWAKLGAKVSSGRLSQLVPVVFLHPIVDRYNSLGHRAPFAGGT